MIGVKKIWDVCSFLFTSQIQCSDENYLVNSWLTVQCLLCHTIFKDNVTKSIFMHAQFKPD